MSLSMGPNTGLLINGAPGDPHFAELMRMWRWDDFLRQPVVKSRVATLPSSGQVEGDTYIFTGAGGNQNKLARWSTYLATAAWEYLTPRLGWEVKVADELDGDQVKTYQFTGSAWAEKTSADIERLVDSPYCTAGGTASAITLAVDYAPGAPTAYRAGAQFRLRALSPNPGATTINVAGLGDKPAVTVTGVALPAGYIRTDVDTTITYDAVGDQFVVDREVERGSNTNGTFTRWADGSQKCGLAITVTDQAINSAYGGLFQGSRVWTFPAMFAARPSVPGPKFTATGQAGWGGSTGASTTTAAVLRGFDIASRSVGVSVDIEATAEGYWYT